MNGIFNKISEIIVSIYSNYGNTSYRLYKYKVQPNISEFIYNCFDIDADTLNNGERMIYEIDKIGSIYVFIVDAELDTILSSEFINYDNSKIDILIIPLNYITSTDPVYSIHGLYYIVSRLIEIIKTNYNSQSPIYGMIWNIAPYVLIIDFIKNSTQYNEEEIIKYMSTSNLFNDMIDDKVIKSLISNPFDIYNILDMGLILRMKRELK